MTATKSEQKQKEKTFKISDHEISMAPTISNSNINYLQHAHTIDT